MIITIIKINIAYYYCIAIFEKNDWICCLLKKVQTYFDSPKSFLRLYSFIYAAMSIIVRIASGRCRLSIWLASVDWNRQWNVTHNLLYCWYWIWRWTHPLLLWVQHIWHHQWVLLQFAFAEVDFPDLVDWLYPTCCVASLRAEPVGCHHHHHHL